MTAKVSDFIPDEHNANKGTERGLKLLDDSLRQYGAGRSILVDKNGRVIAGNKTLERAADVGIENVRVVETDGTELVAVKRTDLDLLTDERARLLAYADNRVGEVDLSFDPAQIAADLEAGVDLSGLWSDGELADLLADFQTDEPKDAEPQVDRAAELQEKWQTASGQLWRIGEHRLLCGDSTKREDVERVMGGEKARAVVTDPPYGIGYTYDEHDDSREKWFDLINKVMPILRQVGEFVVMPCCGIDRLGWWYQNHTPDWMMCWYKGSPGHRSYVGFNDWEAHLVWGKPPSQIHDYWQTECGFDVDGHPCPKPLKYAEWLVERAANEGQTIFDAFLGSGTTMVACQNLGRKCRAIEISPAYVAVTLQRMLDAFNIRGELVE